MAAYKALIFDFDGTLCATRDSILYSFEKTFAHYQATAPAAEAVMQAVSTGASLPNILPQLHPVLPQEELQEWVTTYRHIYSTEGTKFTTLFPGTEQLLQTAHATGHICIVISNKGQRAIEEALTKYHIAGYFDLVIGDDPKVPIEKKPHPMAFQELIVPRYPHVQPQQFLMIGDTHADLGFANNAGIDACWAAYGYGDQDLCLEQAPRYIIRQPLDVKNIL
ncbi:HAD hydrolase-like protein [Nibribacter ruber]|uniref:phosphoglycolate phosphatase n=1 Tax=Nibribacter ruber TaxID=2698458 RepID=A0A6P1NYQ4_9BACT|nr:HAD family hydrolase [Nibribacter ruber]QHL87108.1 HAD hydrolase-like protein [Nibribacter ruber]